jgi:hypothetical protein
MRWFMLDTRALEEDAAAIIFWGEPDVQAPVEPKLPAMWSNPLDGRVKCTTFSHEVTILVLFTWRTSTYECVDLDSGKAFTIERGGLNGGIAIGIWNYVSTPFR